MAGLGGGDPVGGGSRVYDGGDGTTEGVRRDSTDASLIEDRSQSPPYVVGRQGRVVAAEEDQVFRVRVADDRQPLANRLSRVGRDSDRATRL